MQPGLANSGSQLAAVFSPLPLRPVMILGKDRNQSLNDLQPMQPAQAVAGNDLLVGANDQGSNKTVDFKV